jgi:hypothetical protein
MKTGGMTLIHGLSATFAEDEIYPHQQLDIPDGDGGVVGLRHTTLRYLRRLPDERRRRIRVYVGHFPLVAREVLGGDVATLTILRDPVERTLSLLRQLRREAPYADPSRRHTMGDLSLEEVYEQPGIFEPLIRNHQTKIFSLSLDDAPSGYMHVIDVDRARLETAKANLESVDVVGVTERYEAFVDAVVARFGWQLPRGAWANATPPASDDTASAALRRRIADDNALDLELHEHARSLTERRRPAGSAGIQAQRMRNPWSSAAGERVRAADLPRPPGRRFFFIHVMKTGGTTLARQLKASFPPEERYPNPELDIRYVSGGAPTPSRDAAGMDLRQHLSIAYLLELPEERLRRIRLYTGHWPYVASTLLGDDFFRFTLLRDPVERTVSLLRQHRRSLHDLGDRGPDGLGPPLEALYEDPFFYEAFVHNHQTRMFSISADDEPRGYLHVIDIDERRLAQAKSNLDIVDVVGLTEDSEAFVAELSRCSGLTIDGGRRRNVTRAEDRVPVSESFRRRIAEDNAFDMALYEHARRLVERRRGGAT